MKKFSVLILTIVFAGLLAVSPLVIPVSSASEPGVFDSCDSLAAGNWAVNFGQYPFLTLNTNDKVEGTASIQYTAGDAWSGNLWDTGNWDFTNAPIITCYIKASHVGNQISLSCWAGGAYYRIGNLQVTQDNTWTYCTIDLSSANGLPLNHVDILVFGWEGDINMQGQTFQIDNIKTATNAAPTPNPTPTPNNPTPTPSLPQSMLGIYWDQACTNQISTNSISWGSLSPGSTTSMVLYVRNQATSPVTLSLTASNFNPSNVASYLTLSWGYGNQVLTAGGVLKITLTLAVASNTPAFSNFGFDTIITASG